MMSFEDSGWEASWAMISAGPMRVMGVPVSGSWGMPTAAQMMRR